MSKANPPSITYTGSPQLIANGYGWIGAGHRVRDWTLGCIAVTDDEIEEIWRLVPNGTPVEIRP